MEYKARPRSGWTRFILVYGLPDARFPPKGFSKNILHPSGFNVMLLYRESYELKDVSGIFQPSLISVLLHPEGRESISAKRKIVRLRLIFHLAEKKSVSCAKRFSLPYKVRMKHGLKDVRMKVQWVNGCL